MTRAIVAALILTALYGVVIEPSRLVVREYPLALPQLPADLSGVRVALVADIHAGAPWIRERKLRRIVSEVNAAKPDLILLLGDYVTMAVLGGRRIAPERLTPILSGLRAPYGTYAVLGNHDGWFNRTRVSASLERAGITVLRNESSSIAIGTTRLTLLGLADVRTDAPDLSAVASLPQPVIVMTHSPDVFPKIRTPVLLTVAAHTHGGQVRLPLLGSLIVPSVYGQRYARGHIVERGQHLFVSTGIGTSLLPVRIGVVPEITILELRSPARSADDPSRSTSPRPMP
jgi:uncharacterized protein